MVDVLDSLQSGVTRTARLETKTHRSDIHEEASVKTKEQDEHGTSQTSIRHHPQPRSAMKEYAVAPIHASGVALRHVGPRDATWVPLSILTGSRLDSDLVTSWPSPVRCAPSFARLQLLMPGEAESGSAGVQPDEEYPGRRCANGASGPGTDTCFGAIFFAIGHRSYALKNAP